MNKDELIQKARERLDALQADIDRLEGRLQSASEDARARARVQLDKVRDAAGELRERIADLQESAEDRLQELRQKTDAAADKALKRLEELRAKLGL